MRNTQTYGGTTFDAQALAREGASSGRILPKPASPPQLTSQNTAPEQVIFVGGAPRSGTTLAHALICSAPDVSNYHAEISFYQGLMTTLDYGLQNWSIHTEDYFPDQDAYLEMIRDLSTTVLNRVAANLGSQRILCVKDPMLTPRFPVLGLLHPDAKFVTVTRHPDDVVRSRQAVHEHQHGPGSFTISDVQDVAQQYVQLYTRALDGDHAGRQFMFRYEDIGDPAIQQQLAEFCGTAPFDTSQLWKGQKIRDGEPANSPKLGGAIDTNSRLGGLPADWSELTGAICATMMRRLGYERR